MKRSQLKNGMEELILADKSLGTGWFSGIRRRGDDYFPKQTRGITLEQFEARKAFAEKHGITVGLIALVIKRKYP